MSMTLEWKNQLAHEMPFSHPAGLVELDDDAMSMVEGGTSWACVIGTVGVTVALCSPNGTFCGSCTFGTNGCCN